LISPSVAESGTGASGAVAGVVVGGSGATVGSSVGARTEISGGVVFTFGLVSTAGASEGAVCVAPLVSSIGVIETAFPSVGISRTSLSGAGPARICTAASCPFGGTFLLNHRNDATIDTSAKSTAELEGAHWFWPCDNDSGTPETHSHGKTGGFSPPGTMTGSLSAYACEFVLSDRAGPPVVEGKGDVAGPGTPSSKRARRERLSALRARTPVRHCLSVVPSKHCNVPCSPETITASLPSILCVGADSLKATRGKWSGLSAKREPVPGTSPTKAVSSSG
jgi:hypothetical protein